MHLSHIGHLPPESRRMKGWKQSFIFYIVGSVFCTQSFMIFQLDQLRHNVLFFLCPRFSSFPLCRIAQKKASLEPSRNPLGSRNQNLRDCQRSDPNQPVPNQIRRTPCWSDTFFLMVFFRGGWALDKSFCQFQTTVAQENEKLQVQRLSHSYQKICLPKCIIVGRFGKSRGHLLFHRFTHSNILLIHLHVNFNLSKTYFAPQDLPGQNPWAIQLGAAACASTHPEGSGFFFHFQFSQKRESCR